MPVERLTEEEISEAFVRIIRSNVPGDVHIYLFGSRMDGTFNSTSDYDLCIDAGRMIEGHVMQEIREQLERLPILQKIDISDYSNLNQEFRDKIKKVGRILG